jgi:hypothetical protein
MWFGLETEFIRLAYNHNKLQQVFHSYQSQDMLNLQRSKAGLPSNLPASVADAQNLSFN